VIGEEEEEKEGCSELRMKESLHTPYYLYSPLVNCVLRKGRRIVACCIEFCSEWTGERKT
jgi:hypothetical protein